MAKTISLTVNGQSISTPEGTLIVNAAKMAGITIPVFCYHPKMEPVGMCRQCLVEVGRPMIDRATGKPILENGVQKIQFGAKLETACTTPVSDGMVVVTNSEKARANQNDILEFLLTSHPLDCPVCDKGGECPLQNQTMAYGPDESRFVFSEKMHLAKKLPLGDLIYLDRERCIQCARCIRFQDEIAGDSVLGFYQRGRSMEIISTSTPGFDSIFSGNTTDICPVGALTSADFRFGSQLNQEAASINTRIGARPWELKTAASICGHCPVGCNIALNTRRESSTGKVGIKRVMPRQNEAVNELWICDKGRFAYHFAESDDRLGHPQVRKNNKLEDASWEVAVHNAAAKLKNATDGILVLAGGRLSNEDLFNLKQLADGLGGKALLYTHMGGGEYTSGIGMTEGSNFADLGKGSTILVVASDLYNEAPVWYLRVKQAAKRGATLIVVNGRETELERFAQFVVRYSYGDETQTLDALLEKGGKLAGAVKDDENLVILYGSDGLGLAGTEALAGSCAKLLTTTGHTGKLNNGLIGVWPRANDQAAWELGFTTEPDLAAVVKDKTVYVVAADPAGDDPKLAEALKETKALIVQELFPTATTALADIVLPAQAYLEREGSFTSGERRVQRFYPVLPARFETFSDFAITARIAAECGLEAEGRTASLVMDRLSGAVKAFSGITYARLSQVVPQWPIVGRGDMYYGGTLYENSQGLGVHLALVGPGPSHFSDGSGPTLRPEEDRWLAVPVTRLYDRGITVSSSGLLRQHIGNPSIYLNAESARSLGVGAGDQIAINDALAKAVLDDSVPAGVVLVPRSMGLVVESPLVAELKRM